MVKTNVYMRPCPIRVDRAGRLLDSAGKLQKQEARPDLKDKNYKDDKRSVSFNNI